MWNVDQASIPGITEVPWCAQSFISLFILYYYYLFCSSARRMHNFSSSCTPPAQKKLPHPEILFLWNILLISISKCAD